MTSTSSTVSSVGSAVSAELDSFDGYLRKQMRSNTALLDTVVRYIMKQRGKRVRPTLVFLAAGLCGNINDRSYVGAGMVELLHTATLVHDDVVDDAEERRGMASINAVWKNKIAVLVGDYLLSRGLLMAVNANEFDFLRITSNAVRRMSEGELLQIQKRRQRHIDEETYFRIISDKTASLISTCCEVGGVSADASPEWREALRAYGELVGLAFQVRDDILDYVGRSSILGKPVGHDIRDNKVTLPLILACIAAGKTESKAILSIVKSKNVSRSDVKRVIDFVERYGGIDAATTKALDFSAKAIGLLQPFPESVYKQALTDFANFVVLRSK
jgi:octaprenyl-diphosphate synthase